MEELKIPPEYSHEAADKSAAPEVVGIRDQASFDRTRRDFLVEKKMQAEESLSQAEAETIVDQELELLKASVHDVVEAKWSLDVVVDSLPSGLVTRFWDDLIESKDFAKVDQSALVEKMSSSKEGRLACRHVFRNRDKFSDDAIFSLAEKIIESGPSAALLVFFGKFKETEQIRILRGIIKKGGYGLHVLEQMLRLITVPLDPEIADELCGAGKSELLLKNFKKFKDFDVYKIPHVEENLPYYTNDFATWLIAAGKINYVKDVIGKFKGLDKKIADDLIAAGYLDTVIVYFDKFSDLSEEEIIKKAVEAGKGYAVVKYLYRFSKESYSSIESILETDEGITALVKALNVYRDINNLPKSFAMKLIQAGYGEEVAMNILRFIELDPNEAANKMIECGQLETVANHFDVLTSVTARNVSYVNITGTISLNQTFPDTLIQRGEMKILAEYIANFKGISAKNATLLIEAGYGGAVAGSIQSFVAGDIPAIFQTLIDNGAAADIAKNLEQFSGLTAAQAEVLSGAGMDAEIGDHLSSFEDGLPSSLADKLFVAGKGACVALQIDKFAGVDRAAYCNKLIDAGEAKAVLNYLHNFAEVDLSALAQRIIDNGQMVLLAKYLNQFFEHTPEGGILTSDIAKALIKVGGSKEVADWIKIFNISDHAAIAKAIIAKEGENRFAAYMGDFKNLTADIAFKLFKGQHHTAVARNINNFIVSDHNVIAEELADRFPATLANCMHNFKELGLPVALKLADTHLYAVINHISSFVQFEAADINAILKEAHLLEAKKIIAAFSLTQAEIADPAVLLSFQLPPWSSLDELRRDPALVKILEEAAPSERGNIFIGYLKEHEWEEELRGWHDQLSGLCGADSANRYLLLACENGKTAHDALFFIPILVAEFSEHSASLANIIKSVNSEEDGKRLAKHAGSYTSEGLKNCGMPVPDTLSDFIRTAILIKKNFVFPADVSAEVREKIGMILASVKNTAALANDLASSDRRLIRLLENSDGLDQSAIIQPIPELSMRISALGDILKSALGSRELVKISGAIGHLQKEIGPRIFDIQKRALLAEESALKRRHAATYAKPPADVELINLKKNHAWFLESLKIVKGGSFAIIDDKGGSEKKISKLVESLPSFQEASAEGRIELLFETLKPVYDALCRALSKDTIGNNFQTDPVLAQLVESVRSNEAGEQIIQQAGESTIEFWERVAAYMEQVIDQYVALVSRAQKLKDAEDLYRQTEKIIAGALPEAGKEAMKKFLADPESVFATHAEVEQKIENLLSSKGINIGEKLVARVLTKSDPRGIVCGDDTNCCMPYGDTKNYEYMYRGDTAYFTISISRNGEEHTIAQSVLVAADKEKSDNKNFSVLAFDNIEVAHAYEKLTPNIAEMYKQVISEYWPDKTIVMGTSYNDDRELVRSMGELVRNKYAPLEGELEYSDCFDHDTLVKLRDPVEGGRENLAPRLGFVTPAMLTLGNPLREQLAANYNLSKEAADELLAALAPSEQVLYRDEDNDPIFAADNVSVQVTLGGQPVMLLIALDKERDELDWDEIEIKTSIAAPGADAKQVEEALVTFFSLQPEDGYMIKIPLATFSDYTLDPELICKQSGFQSCVVDSEFAYFKGTPDEWAEDDDDFDYDGPYDEDE